MATDTLQIDEATRVSEQIRRCEVSREWRRTQCDNYESVYKKGSESQGSALYNLSRAHIDRVGSYLFAPGTARFGVHLPASDRAQWLEASETARDEFRESWTDSGAEIVLVTLLEWALVDGCRVAKVQHDPQTGFRVGAIDQRDFGVSREDVPSLDDQDTLAHWYTLSVPQIQRMLRMNPRLSESEKNRLLIIANEHKQTGLTTGHRGDLVITNVSGTFPNQTITGGFGDGATLSDIRQTQVDEPLVQFVDCWERNPEGRLFKIRGLHGEKDDIVEDWLVTTQIVGANLTFARRRNPDLGYVRTGRHTILPAELPFVPLVPRPQEKTFWGESELEFLKNLQAWMEDILQDIKKSIKRQLDPSKFISGVADWEEATRAMETPGGGYGSQDPGARMEQLKISIGQETFEVMKLIREFFADSSGIPESLSEPGQVGGGVRAMGHFQMMAGIGAGRIRRMALVVEDPISQIATKGFRVMQRNDPHRYTTPKGKSFLLSDLPAGLTIRVDAHSASPIFSEQTQAKAMVLQRIGAIGFEDTVDLVDPPHREQLKAKAKEREAARAEMAKIQLEIQAEKARGKRTPKALK